MKGTVINTKEEIKLNKAVWSETYNEDLVAQTVYVYRSNQRAGTANTKTRTDVSGGGAKPWKQKGTGRARHGSRRSPLWVKGGITFGPNDENWKKRINKKMLSKAFNVVLSAKLADEEMFFVDVSKLGKDTKEIRKKWLEMFDNSAQGYLFITEDENVMRAVRNVVNVTVQKPENKNSYSLLAHKYVVIDKDILDKIENKNSNGKGS